MTFDQIETALGQHLGAMPGCPPIAWANADAPNATPYLEVRHAPNTRDTPVIDGTGFPVQTGIFLVTVVAARGAFTRPANILAQAIADRFPKILRLRTSGGNVVIYRESEPAPGFTDGVHWRQPVRVYYTTEGPDPATDPEP